MNSSRRSFSIGNLALALGGLVVSPWVGAQTAGTMDTSFQPPPLHIVFDVAARPDGRIVVGGGTYDFSSPPFTFVQLLNDGSPDPAFDTGTGPNGVVQDVLLLPGGRMFIGGSFTAYNGVVRAGLARVNEDGSLDTTFPDGGFNGSVNRIARQPEGKLIVTGDFTAVNGVPRAGIARLNADGSLDEGFNPGPQFVPATLQVSRFYAVVVQPNGQILLGGSFGDGSPGTPLNLARIHANGVLDPSFIPPELLLPVFSLALLPGGKILVGGEFWAPQPNLIRVHANGEWDDRFSADVGPIGADPIVDALLVQPDGRILIGGRNFRHAGGLERRLLARLHADGAGDETFAPVSGPNFNGVFALGLQPDGKILAAGSFTEFDGRPAPGLARLHNDGFAERVQFVSANYTATEGQGSAVITVRRIGWSKKSVRVHYQTVADTARPGQDYRPASGQVVFAPGETVKAFTVSLREDNKVEGAETVQLKLRGVATRQVGLGTPSTAILTIMD